MNERERGQEKDTKRLEAGRKFNLRSSANGDYIQVVTVAHSPYVNGRGALVVDLTSQRGRSVTAKVSDLSLDSGEDGEFYLTEP